MPKPTPITIRQLAELAGVSRQTASDALRGTGRVSEATRLKVRQVAESLNYHPDPLIAIGFSQMRRRSYRRLQSTLAFIETGIYPGLTEKFAAYRRMMAGVKTRAEELGYGLEKFWLGNFLSRPGSLERVLRARGIKGVILLYVKDWKISKETSLQFNPQGFACVTLGSRLREPELDFASADHFGNTCKALNHLEKLGHKRIGLLIPRGLDQLLEGRISYAYEGWVRSLSKRIRIPPFYTIGDDSEKLFQQLCAYHCRHKPDALYGITQWDHAKRLTSEVKGKLIWASMECSKEENPGCGTDQSHEEVGSAGVDMVNSQLTHGRYGIPLIARGTLIEGQWLDSR